MQNAILSLFTPIFFIFSSLLSTFKLSGNTSVLYAASPTIYYVSNYGSDSNTGTKTSPFKTINQAVTLATPGTIIYVTPGTYTQHVLINDKSGTPTSPITIIGENSDPAQYPVFDGGDPSYSSTVKNPSFTVQNSSWIVFERIKVVNSTDTAYRVANSHYIVIRRNIIDYHSSAILLKSKSSHILAEYNEIYQSYPVGSTWTQLKSTKWEGGAFKSDGGAGMNTIRFNYLHDQFNAIFLTSGNRTDGKYYDANTWVYRNRFENIVDDAYEPETYAFNNHFFNNTLINSHRLVSLAPGYKNLLGPIYIYDNLQIINQDPTLEAKSGRINSTYKIDLSSGYYQYGVFAFNNSIDIATTGNNAYAIDFLNTNIHNFSHKNHAYRTNSTSFNKSVLLGNGIFNFDMSNKSFGYIESNGFPSTDPQFTNPQFEDLKLISTSPARGKSSEISIQSGFTSTLVIPKNSDLGAFQYGENDFRKTPSPIYTPPPGGEYPNFPQNYNWPADTFGGVNPIFGPLWQSVVIPTAIVPTQIPTIDPTKVPTQVSTKIPTPTPTKTTTSTVTLSPVADSYVSSSRPNKNYGTTKNLTISSSPQKITYFKFDLSQFVGRIIKTAKISLSIIDNSQSTQNFKFINDNSWSEKSITFNNRPQTGNQFATQTNVKGRFESIDVTVAVQSKVGSIFSFAIDSVGGTQFQVSSKEGYNSPKLTLVFQ